MRWFATFYYLRKALKSQNNSKFIKEQEVLTNLTIDGTQHQKMLIGEIGINAPLSWTSRIQNTSKNYNLYPHQSRITYHSLLWDTLYLTERRIFEPNDKFSNKNGNISAWRDFKKILCDVYRYGKWNFKLKHTWLEWIFRSKSNK